MSSEPVAVVPQTFPKVLRRVKENPASVSTFKRKFEVDSADQQVYEAERPLPHNVEDAYYEYKRRNIKAKFRRAINLKFEQFIKQRINQLDLNDTESVAVAYLNHQNK